MFQFSNPCYDVNMKSTIPVELTSHEEEYSVKAVKHVFDAYVVIEYTCSHKFPGVTWNNVGLACHVIDIFTRKYIYMKLFRFF